MSLFCWTDLFVRFPFIGLIARNSRNFETGRDGWMNAEEKLCSAYKKFISQIPREKFLQRIEYLKHAGDLGRTPMGFARTLFLFLLVAAESMGFSYLLGTWAASDGSAALYTQLMYGIVAVLASILAMITHSAGAQFYRTRLIRSCYTRYRESGSAGFHSTRVISLSDDQFADKDEPSETRCLNRIINAPHDMGSYGWSWVAGTFVVAIFVLSGVMRFSHMQAELTRESQVVEAATSNPFAKSTLPRELVKPQQEADRKAASEARASTAVEGGAAIIILGVIFVVTQIVGFDFGYRFGFAGKETYKRAAGSASIWWWSSHDGAYADTWGYSTHDAYWGAMQPFKDIVNLRLKTLQQRLKQNKPQNLQLTRNFDDYLLFQARIAETSKNTSFASTEGDAYPHTVGTASAPVPVAVAPAESSTVKPSPAASTAVSPATAGLETFDPNCVQAKQEIEAIADVEAQKRFFERLPKDVREALKPWLIERKDAKAAAISKAELDALF